MEYPQLADEAWLREQYVDRRLSQTAIARRLGCSQAAVSYRLVRFGILPPHRERAPRKPRRDRGAEIHKTRLIRLGLTQGEWDWLVELQGGVCRLCSRPETRVGATSLSVDHDHSCHPFTKSGQTHACKECIRALLCRDCNHMIGLVEKAGGAVAARFADYLARRPFAEKGGEAEVITSEQYSLAAN
jgi:hypothetical protein